MAIYRIASLWGMRITALLLAACLLADSGYGADHTTLHYASNTSGRTSHAIEDGFTVMDVTGSPGTPAHTASLVNALPAGVLALVWVGNLDNAPKGSACPSPGFTFSQFKAQVDALAGNPKVYGYFLADEPHPSVCPHAATDIKQRADYIHAHTTQKAFIVVLDGDNLCPNALGCEYRALAPNVTHADLIGIDPYPCHYDASGKPAPCDASRIAARVQSAIANGIPQEAIVPVFQAFGQEGRKDGKKAYYRTPAPAELQAMLIAWQSAVPAPAMDYSYTFGVQCSASGCPAPQAISNHPELAAILRAHNRLQ
ncbi:MAG TPA: hypothetical protein VFT64_03315 [Rickettsiales bacterium]|nr:hypothetical protein [Rickettsiales bacterium]